MIRRQMFPGRDSIPIMDIAHAPIETGREAFSLFLAALPVRSPRYKRSIEQHKCRMRLTW